MRKTCTFWRNGPSPAFQTGKIGAPQAAATPVAGGEARRLLQLTLHLGAPTLSRLEALGRAVSHFGRAGTAASSGWTLGSELILTKGLFDPVVVPTHGL